MLKHWCLPFYYSEGYGLGDITSDEDDDEKSINNNNNNNNNNNTKTSKILDKSSNDLGSKASFSFVKTYSNSSSINSNNYLFQQHQQQHQQTNSISNYDSNNKNSIVNTTATTTTITTNNNNNNKISNSPKLSSIKNSSQSNISNLSNSSNSNNANYNSNHINSSTSNNLNNISNNCKDNYLSELEPANLTKCKQQSDLNSQLSLSQYQVLKTRTSLSPSSTSTSSSNLLIHTSNSNNSNCNLNIISNNNSNNNCNNVNNNNNNNISNSNANIVVNNSVNSINSNNNSNGNTNINNNSNSNINFNNNNNNSNNPSPVSLKKLKIAQSSINNKNECQITNQDVLTNKKQQQQPDSNDFSKIENNKNSNNNNNHQQPQQQQQQPLSKIPTIQLESVEKIELTKTSSAPVTTTTTTTITQTTATAAGASSSSSLLNSNTNNTSNKTHRSKLKNMMRKATSSQSSSKSYEEDRRKNFLNSFLNYRDKFDSSSRQATIDLDPSSSSNSKPCVKFALSLDTYKRINGPNLSKERSVEVDDMTLATTSNNLSASNLNINNNNQNKSITSVTAPNSACSTPVQIRKAKNDKLLRKELSLADSTGLSLSTNSLVTGRVYMRVLYDSNTHVLTTTIIQSNRVLTGEKQKLFAKIQFHISLLNREKSPKYKTTIKEYADFIDFNETFYFPNIEKVDLPKYSIQINLYGKETFGSDKLLSQAFYGLTNLNLNEQFNYLTLFFEEYRKPITRKDSDSNSSTDPNQSTIPITPKLQINLTTEKPELLIGLKYDALIGNLYVSILRGSNLYDRYAADKSPNTFVRLTLKLEKSEVKFQTALKRSTSNPIFDESFEFGLATYQVENAKLFIYVYSKRLLSGKNLIGCVLFDDQPGHDKCIEHLKAAITSDGDFINRWHSLVF